ncbi:PIG-L deacetylase family protein [uncultured Pseudomonas sp.]|uniref:PIG-L deacetylase family protein n=1 Tax=uncultured Pseudomonas sp. TaxID=114707 RepID=UPI0025DB5B40|nr:PIG-L deacetylase family protein [uncultured Pseudomonas sp.]
MNEGFVVGTEPDARGTPLAAWQGSAKLAALPATSADLLVPPGCRAVIVAPHPDDEVLGCGGLMSQLQQLQRSIMLISVTDGTASHPGSPLWPAQRLARERPLESAEALRLLGLPDDLHWRRAGLPDGAVAAHLAELETLLLEHLQVNDVVFTTWSGDGHPDHEATGRACASACLNSGARLVEFPLWAWHWATAEDERLPWDRARKVLLDPALLESKRQAVRAFASQLTGDPTIGLEPVLPDWALARLLQPFEVVLL